MSTYQADDDDGDDNVMMLIMMYTITLVVLLRKFKTKFKAIFTNIKMCRLIRKTTEKCNYLIIYFIF